MPTMLKTVLALCVGAGGLLLAAEEQPAKKGEKAAATPLEGTYTIVSGAENGKAVPADRIKGSIVRFTGDTIVGTDKDKKEFFAAKFTLDTSKKPWVIQMKSTAPKEAEATGLIKKDGDTVTLVYALPGGDAPKEFTTKDRQLMFEMKAVKSAAPKDSKAADKK